MTDALAESKTAEAAHAAAVAQEAHLRALEERLTTRILDAVREEMSPEKGRYVDVSRVPLLCQAIVGLDKKLDGIVDDMVTQDQFQPVKIIAYGLVSTTMVGVLGAILAALLR